MSSESKIVSYCSCKNLLTLNEEEKHDEHSVSKIPKVLLEKYDFIKFIEQGGFGEVFLVKKVQSPSSELLALKMIRISGSMQKKLTKLIPNEIKIMKDLKHENIITLKDYFKNDQIFVLITEYGGDDLQEYLKKNKDVLNLKDKIDIALQIANGIYYLHFHDDSLVYIHGDLKLKNIVILNGKVKLIDFGISRCILENEFTSKVYGTLGYMAPEIRSSNSFNGKINFNYKIDIFSCGNIFHKLFYEVKFASKRTKQSYPNSEISKILERLIISMLEADPNKRIDSKKVLEVLTEIKNKLEKEPPNSKLLKSNCVVEPSTTKNSLISGDQKKKLQKIEHSHGTYEGECKEGTIRHGEGSFKCSNGDQYTGTWENDKMHGKGKLIFSNGDVYEGDWKDGKRSGEGKFTTTKGDVYFGSWKDDYYHGSGKMKYSNGNIFDGEWVMGKRSGKGHMEYFTGRRKSYDGSWENNQENGEGVCVMRDNTIYIGKFMDGSNLNQEGIFIYYQDNVKRVYKGKITNDLQNIPVQRRDSCNAQYFKLKKEFNENL